MWRCNESLLVQVMASFLSGADPLLSSHIVNTLVQIVPWRSPGDKPLSEPMMVRLPTHTCVTRPQWVNSTFLNEIRIKDTKCISKCLKNVGQFSFGLNVFRSTKLHQSAKHLAWQDPFRTSSRHKAISKNLLNHCVTFRRPECELEIIASRPSYNSFMGLTGPCMA